MSCTLILPCLCANESVTLGFGRVRRNGGRRSCSWHLISPECRLALLVLLKWAGPSVFNRLSHLIDEKLMFLDVEWWHKLDDGLRACGVRTNRGPIAVDLAAMPESISERLMVALATRVRDESLVHTSRLA